MRRSVLQNNVVIADEAQRSQYGFGGIVGILGSTMSGRIFTRFVGLGCEKPVRARLRVRVKLLEIRSESIEVPDLESISGNKGGKKLPEARVTLGVQGRISAGTLR